MSFSLFMANKFLKKEQHHPECTDGAVYGLTDSVSVYATIYVVSDYDSLRRSANVSSSLGTLETRLYSMIASMRSSMLEKYSAIKA